MKKQIILNFLTTGLKTDLDLLELLSAIGGIKVGTKKICNQEDHCSQFKALSDIVLERVYNYIVSAGRTGSKTFLFGGFDSWWKACSKPHYSVNVLGGSQEQSFHSYDAMDYFWEQTGLMKDLLLSDPQKTKSEWRNKSIVRILTASTKSVRGYHPICLKLDETDELEEDVYQSALSQPVSKFNCVASLGLFSTNHRVGGMMDVAIANAVLRNTPVYKYCVFEVLESCRDFSCSTCKLSSICPGRQMKQADGYYKIEDFIQKLLTLSYSMLSRDWLCIKIGTGEEIYSDTWDEKIHLVNVPYNPAKPVVLSMDWGGGHPFAITVWQKVDGLGHVVIDEVYTTQYNRKIIEDCKNNKPWWNNISKFICDPARKDSREEWRDALPSKVLIVKANNDVDDGIDQVSAALAPVSGAPKIFANVACINTRREFSAYRRKNGKIVKEYDDLMDTIRYYVQEEVKNAGGGAFIQLRDVMPS